MEKFLFDPTFPGGVLRQICLLCTARFFASHFMHDSYNIITSIGTYDQLTIDQLNNYTDHQSICRLFLKIDLQENFPALICRPSRQKCILFVDIGVGGRGVARPAQDTEIAAKSL
jgi:hypothetical protein